jgi:hypothetical protein
VAVSAASTRVPFQVIGDIAQATAYDAYKIQRRLWNSGAQAEGLRTIEYLPQSVTRALDSRHFRRTKNRIIGTTLIIHS